jgi:hypothetical protein
MNRLIDVQQGSGDWLSARVGRVTSSRLKDVCDFLKSGKSSAARDGYLIEIVTERLTGQPVPHFTNSAMQHGTDNEPAARVEYAWSRQVEVEETGLWILEQRMFGGSPDGLVGKDGLIEIKCPWSTGIHVRTILNGMPDEHAYQIQGNLYVTNRSYADFISYDPRMPEGLKLYVQRIERDEKMISLIEENVDQFLTEVDLMVTKLREIQNV